MKKKLLLSVFLPVCALVLLGAVSVNGVKLFESYVDFTLISAPSNPTKGFLRFFGNTSTTKMACLDSTGASCLPSGGGYATIQNNGTPVAQEAVLNFVSGVTCVDNPAVATNCTAAGGALPSGFVINQPATFTASINSGEIAGADDTTGLKYIVTSTGQSIKGYKITWNGSTQPVKITLWDLGTGNTGGSSLGTATGSLVGSTTAPNEIDFSSPIAVTQWHFYMLAVYVSTPGFFVFSPINNSPPFPFAFNGPAIAWYCGSNPGNPGCVTAGDAQPTSELGQMVPVEPVFQ